MRPCAGTGRRRRRSRSISARKFPTRLSRTPKSFLEPVFSVTFRLKVQEWLMLQRSKLWLGSASWKQDSRKLHSAEFEPSNAGICRAVGD